MMYFMGLTHLHYVCINTDVVLNLILKDALKGRLRRDHEVIAIVICVSREKSCILLH